MKCLGDKHVNISTTEWPVGALQRYVDHSRRDCAVLFTLLIFVLVEDLVVVPAMLTLYRLTLTWRPSVVISSLVTVKNMSEVREYQGEYQYW